jgi:D-proline reductase (dithiol) PrdB
MNEASTPQTHRRAISYIDRSRDYYAAHGYDKPYQWASYPTVPFHSPVALDKARVGVVTTAFPLDLEFPKKAYCGTSDPVPGAMFTKDLSWDKDATHTDDLGTFLPLKALNALVANGAIGSVSDHFYGVPTEYSKRRTLADAERVLTWAREDDVDVMLLVPL